MPMPPHSSGISIPSTPNSPISRSRSVGQTAPSHASGARLAISFVANSRQSSTRSRSDSVSAKSIKPSYGSRSVHPTGPRCSVGRRREHLAATIEDREDLLARGRRDVDEHLCHAQRPEAIELLAERSEERRVGKECRSRWSPYH